MFIGLGLLASCSNNPDDGLPEPQYDAANSQYGDGKYEERVNRYESAALLRGSYNLSWVVDREEVDTASLSKGDGPHDAFISHFPMAYFFYQPFPDGLFLESDREEGGADRNQLYLESISLEAKL